MPGFGDVPRVFVQVHVCGLKRHINGAYWRHPIFLLIASAVSVLIVNQTLLDHRYESTWEPNKTIN